MPNDRNHDFKVASKIGSSTSDFTNVKSETPTDKCSLLGADYVYSKCYTTQGFDIDPSRELDRRYNINDTSGTINFDDQDTNGGANLVLYWLKFNDDPAIRDIIDPIIVEVGIRSLGEPEFGCVKDGYPVSYNFETIPLSNVDYEFKM